jgi:hypothetical protein
VVPPHIVVLRPDDERKIPRHESEQNLVAAAVIWLIVILVYLYRLVDAPKQTQHASDGLTFEPTMLLA